jgi:hypothetical protein
MSALDTLFCENYLSFLHLCGDRLLGIRSDTVDCGQSHSYRQILEEIQLLIQGPEHVFEVCKQKFELWTVDSEEELVNRSCDISLKNQRLRANFWKKIYCETCQ